MILLHWMQNHDSLLIGAVESETVESQALMPPRPPGLARGYLTRLAEHDVRPVLGDSTWP